MLKGLPQLVHPVIVLGPLHFYSCFTASSFASTGQYGYLQRTSVSGTERSIRAVLAQSTWMSCRMSMTSFWAARGKLGPSRQRTVYIICSTLSSAMLCTGAEYICLIAASVLDFNSATCSFCSGKLQYPSFPQEHRWVGSASYTALKIACKFTQTYGKRSSCMCAYKTHHMEAWVRLATLKIKAIYNHSRCSCGLQHPIQTVSNPAPLCPTQLHEMGSALKQ
jgi:hypothetical protein